jgi:hypothetical protein
MNAEAQTTVKPGKHLWTCLATHMLRVFPLGIGKKTIFVTGFGDDVDEQELLQAFVTFGETVPVRLVLVTKC